MDTPGDHYRRKTEQAEEIQMELSRHLLDECLGPSIACLRCRELERALEFARYNGGLMERTFTYYLKLRSGELVHAEGTNWEEAARAAGVNLREVRRHMPVKVVLTEGEREAQRERLEKLRRQKGGNDE